jgi:transposase
VNQPQDRGATNVGFCAFVLPMDSERSDIPNDLQALRAALVAERDRRIVAETLASAARAEAAAAKAEVSNAEALIAHLKLQLEKMRRDYYGTRSERTARLMEQMELQLEELETSVSGVRHG